MEGKNTHGRSRYVGNTALYLVMDMETLYHICADIQMRSIVITTTRGRMKDGDTETKEPISPNIKYE